MSKILMINDKGIYMILLFSLYVIYLGIYALIDKDIEFVATGKPGEKKEGLQIVLFDTDLTQLIGVFALAYMVHNAVTGLMKNNKKSENNSRDLFFAYSIVWTKYTILGVFGSFAVAALYNSDYDIDNKPNNIMDLLSKETDFLYGFSRIMGIIALFFVLVQLTTVLPILNFFTRRQFFGLILGSEVEKLSKFQTHMFNLAFNLVCLGFEIPVFEPVVVISYTGALGGFLLIYIIPIYCHLTCLYFDKKKTTGDSGSEGESVDSRSEADINTEHQNLNKEENDRERKHSRKSKYSENNKSKPSINQAEHKVKILGFDEEKVERLIQEEEMMCRTDHTHEKTYNKW
eukprot:CAMPEP_0170536680 /NCGR_PEP_ID=MMETSP0209-20121228/102281_1 /TAXON_ID=665100 ORGANISM="Litonotus pictus, Strain P1" /NCGR_SAMPLE_ID=MMETSP0209 /ASSEMBLY_ACC=CAM_ASM_000301 /LENGTH=344 /DNA_ID=CAMNT_0010838067 /DNA_START=652 /DNA_END=1683 /DNA_ORIENTATION=+